MKKSIIVGVICVLLLIACFSPWRDEDLGTFTVITGSGQNGRTIWDEGEGGNKEDLTYEINISGGPETVPVKTVSGSKPVQYTVKPGYYKIFIFAFLPEYGWESESENEEQAPDILQAVGSETVYIKAGKNNAVTITMKEPDGDGYYKVTFELEGQKINRYVPAGETVTVPKKFREKKQTLEAGLYNTTLESAEVSFEEYSKWYREDNNGQFNFEEGINENITLTGKWVELPEPNSDYKSITADNIAGVFDGIIKEMPGEYTILLNENINFSSPTVGLSLSKGGAEEDTYLTFIGIDEPRTITINSGAFNIYEKGYLTLDKNITLEGTNTHTSPLVKINSGGTLTMKDGSKITGNANPIFWEGGEYISEGEGGGVYVGEGGTFNMYGGTISGNSADFGGGVYVGAEGTFTMTGGSIIGNNAGNGGGVYVASGDSGTGIFKMEGGTISGNGVKSEGYKGGGVYTKGSFIIPENSSNVTISGNNAAHGGGVYVDANGNFTMENGVISGNEAYYGGGVYSLKRTSTSRPFTKTGGIIYGGYYNGNDNNTAWVKMSGEPDKEYGHAVYEIVTEDDFVQENYTLGLTQNWP